MSLNQIERAQGLRVRSTQDMWAGLFMILFACVAVFMAWDLPMGSLRQIGAGMLPKSIATICGALGVILALSSLRYHGEALTPWSWRAVIHVLGGTVLFALAIRGFDLGPIHVPSLGLVIAGPLVVLFSGMAASDRSLKELVIFAAVMTFGCALLFKYALGLPIPLAPWLLGI
ncbi:tripartite tricarboxylate transporter TctB family protein [Bosea sp. NPDC055353]